MFSMLKTQFDVEHLFLNGYPIELWPDIIRQNCYTSILASHKETIGSLWPDIKSGEMTASQRYLKLLACMVSSVQSDPSFIKQHAKELVLVLPAVFSFGNDIDDHEPSTFDAWCNQVFSPETRIDAQDLLIHNLIEQSALLNSCNAYISWLSRRLSRPRAKQDKVPTNYNNQSDWDNAIKEQLLYYLNRFSSVYRHMAETTGANTSQLKTLSDRQSRICKLSSTFTFHPSQLPAFSAFALVGIIRYVVEKKSVNLQHILMPHEWKPTFSSSMLHNEQLYTAGLSLTKELRGWLARESTDFYQPVPLPREYKSSNEEDDSTSTDNDDDDINDVSTARFLLPVCKVRDVAKRIGLAGQLDESAFNNLYKELPNILYSHPFMRQKVSKSYNDKVARVVAIYHKLIAPETYNLLTPTAYHKDCSISPFEAALYPIANELSTAGILGVSTPPDINSEDKNSQKTSDYYHKFIRRASCVCDPTEFLYALAADIPIFKGSNPLLSYYQKLENDLKKQIKGCCLKKSEIQELFKISPSQVALVQHELNIYQMREVITPGLMVNYVNSIPPFSKNYLPELHAQLLKVLPKKSPLYRYLSKLSISTEKDKVRIVAFYRTFHKQIMRYIRQFCISVLWKATLRVYFSESQFPQDLDRSQHSDNVASQEKPSSK